MTARGEMQKEAERRARRWIENAPVFPESRAIETLAAEMIGLAQRIADQVVAVVSLGGLHSGEGLSRWNYRTPAHAQKIVFQSRLWVSFYQIVYHVKPFAIKWGDEIH